MSALIFDRGIILNIIFLEIFKLYAFLNSCHVFIKSYSKNLNKLKYIEVWGKSEIFTLDKNTFSPIGIGLL